MTYVLLHTGVFLIVVGCLIAAGLVWSRLLFRPLMSTIDGLIPLLVMAFGSWSIAAFALCAAQLFRWPIVGVLMVGSVGGGAYVLVGRTRTPRTWSVDRSSLILLVPLAIVLGGLYLLALTPIPAWDADHYHLTIPRLYVEAGGFTRIPFSLQSNWPLHAELLYGLVLLFSDHVSAALVHYLFAIATCLLLLVGAVQSGVRSGVWAGAIAAALFLCNPIVQYEAYVAYIDLAVAFFFVAGFLALWRTFEDPDRASSWCLLAGLSAGFLAGTKVNGVFSVGVLALFAVWRWLRSTERPSLRLVLTNAVLPAFLLAVIWPLKSLWLTGNPVYPFLIDRFGGGEWSDRLTQQFREAMWSMGMGRTAKDYLLLPLRVILSGDNDFTHFFGRLNHAWVVLIPLAIALGWRNRMARAALGVAALQFISWALASQQMRFLLPAVALLSLGTGIALVEAVQNRGFALPGLGVATAVLLLWSAQPMLASAADWTGVYLKNGSRLPEATVRPAYTFIDRNLPPNARVLLLNTSLAYYVRRDFIADSVFQASQIADWLRDAASPADVHTLLREKGVTHILAMEHSEGAVYPPALIAMLARKNGLRLLFHDSKSAANVFEVCADLRCQ